MVFFSILFNGGLIPSYLMWTQTFHIKDTIFALLVPNLMMNGFSVIVMRSFFQSSIPEELLEAAKLDGASRWQTLVHVTLPNLKPTIIVMLVLSIGNLMTGGFEQIFNLSNPAVADVCEILDMYIYRVTFGSVPDFGFSMAISLFRSVVNCFFLVAADWGAKKLGGTGLFG